MATRIGFLDTRRLMLPNPYGFTLMRSAKLSPPVVVCLVNASFRSCPAQKTRPVPAQRVSASDVGPEVRLVRTSDNDYPNGRLVLKPVQNLPKVLLELLTGISSALRSVNSVERTASVMAFKLFSRFRRSTSTFPPSSKVTMR